MKRLAVVVAAACSSPARSIPPTFAAEMTDGTGWTTRGSIAFDGTAKLIFPGDPALSSGDKVGPDHATEMSTAQPFGFGTFRTRARLATCAPGEEIVNGLFVYANDGSDANGNGIADNTEIDLEILCGEPTSLWLTSWTDYEVQNGQEVFRKKSRLVDVTTGAYSETPAGAENTYDVAPAGTIPGLSLATLTGDWIELGFERHAAEVRWFLVDASGHELTLWDLTDTSVIPQAPAPFFANLWHPDAHWVSGTAADYPAADGEMDVDWVRFWAE